MDYHNLKHIQAADLENKKVLLRVDFNVPLNNAGEVQDKTRIEAALPTIRHILAHARTLILVTHMGRPKGQVVPELKTDVLKEVLSHYLPDTPITKVDSCIGDAVTEAIDGSPQKSIVLLENVRFHPEEKANEDAFATTLASYADVFVNDAFATAHRKHASTYGVTKHLPSYAGFLMAKEVEVLSKLMKDPAKPLLLIVGGAKIDTKIGIIKQFIGKADQIMIGGGIANTFLAAKGYDVKDSLYEQDKIELARELSSLAEQNGTEIIHTQDVIVAEEIKADSCTEVVRPDEIKKENAKILDIGPQTIAHVSQCIKLAKTIIWNGPVGLYEMEPFAEGTKKLAKAVADSEAYSVLGGGDTIDAVKKFGCYDDCFNHISTGGGAMLLFLANDPLPGLEALVQN